jgi:hypothetical protein
MRQAPTKNQRNLKDFDNDGHKKSKNRRGRMLIRPYSQERAFQSNEDFKSVFPNGYIPPWERHLQGNVQFDNLDPKKATSCSVFRQLTLAELKELYPDQTATIETESTSDDSGNGD